jgi:hypothetical protein
MVSRVGVLLNASLKSLGGLCVDDVICVVHRLVMPVILKGVKIFKKPSTVKSKLFSKFH